MSEPELKTCKSCPAFTNLTGEATSGTSGVCRAHAPVAFQDKEYFRGSTRSMLFGVYPAVGVFPLTKEDDWCMEHPGNRDFWAKGIKAAVPAGADTMDIPEGAPPVLPNGEAQAAGGPQAAPAGGPPQA
jgi:hypothetical protein